MSALSQPSGVTASPAEIQSKFDLGIWHALFNWHILTVAIQNQWGGPNSDDKRDWFAGAISEIFENRPETDSDDVEIILLQVLEDEFGIRLEDDTEIQVAREIMTVRKETLEGNFATVDAMQARWEARKGTPMSTGNVQVTERNQEVDWDSVDEESDEDDVDGDVDMSDAPPLVAAKPKPAPEVDEDGFEKVVSKRRR